MGDRCRLCSANDLEALIDQVASDMWDRHRTGSLDNRPWAEAGGYWHDMFRTLAAEAVESLRRRAAA